MKIDQSVVTGVCILSADDGSWSAVIPADALPDFREFADEIRECRDIENMLGSLLGVLKVVRSLAEEKDGGSLVVVGASDTFKDCLDQLESKVDALGKR